jgi:hypothetical protein
MNRKALIVTLMISASVMLQAQNVGISEIFTVPDPSAILDINSIDKGLLIPRMSEVERDSIHNPATGLLIFQTDNDPFFYYYTGTQWKKLCCNPPCENTCIFSDDYNSSTGWTQTGTGVSVTGGVVLFNNADNFPDRRIYKPLSCTLADCGDWTADFELNVTAQTDESHPVLGFTAGFAVPFYDYSLLQETNQDGVFVWMSGWCPTGDSHLSIAAKNGTSRSYSFSSGGCIGISFGTTYYCRFERTAPTTLKLSVFSDAARTIEIPDSPVEFIIPASILGLNYIQHSNYESQTIQTFSGTIDNMSIY